MADVLRLAEMFFEDEFRKFAEETCVHTLISCTPVGYTGGLVGSIGCTKVSDREYIIGTRAKYGGWVNDGRGEVRPRDKKALWSPLWPEIEHPVARSKPSKPRKFIQEAVKRLS